MIKNFILILSYCLCLQASADYKALHNLESSYLNARAQALVLTRKAYLATQDSIEQEKIKLQQQKQFITVQLNHLEKLQAAKSESAYWAFLKKMISNDTLREKMPFDIMEYLPFHKYESYNTFTVPIPSRKIIPLEFKKDLWQYTFGKKGGLAYGYQYKKETEKSFRRSRSLGGGHVGTDVIEYDIFSNQFVKNKELFMWIQK